MQTKHDIVIIGAGMVGLSIAKLLSDLPLSIGLIEANDVFEWSVDNYSSRVSAISPASKKILNQAGVWEAIEGSRVSPYADMQVWEQSITASDALRFSLQDFASDSDIDSLGWIIENELIRAQLKKAIDAQPSKAKIISYIPDSLEDVSVTESNAQITLGSGKQLTAKLVIAADGSNSLTRRKLNLPEMSRSYEQCGVVAQLKTEKPHQNTAYQRFHEQDVLGLLPLANGDCSMVWSCSQSKATSLLSLSEEELATELTEFTQGVLGKITLSSSAKAFPLQLLHSRQYVTERVVLCGDAAHAVHPFAGQGVNLGFLDAAALVDVITEAWSNNYDLGDLSVLRNYERQRKGNNVQMMTGLDTLFAVFQSDNPILQQARRVGMGLVNQIAPIKKLLIQQALGLKNL